MSNGGDDDFEDFLPEITDDTIDTVWIDPETGVTWALTYHSDLGAYGWQAL